MLITKGNLKGTFIIELRPFIDERGYFMRTYDEKEFMRIWEDEGKGVWEDGKRSEREDEKRSGRGNGEKREWVQENHSKSVQKGVLRGLHFQLPPFAETKLIRCIRGKVQDVFVDLRKGSNTYGKWDSVILSEDNYMCVLIPRGFAHGFCTLTDNCEVLYKVDNYYSPEFERGLIWDDPDIGIKWPVENPILSEKDKKNKTLKELMREWGDEGMRI